MSQAQRVGDLPPAATTAPAAAPVARDVWSGFPLPSRQGFAEALRKFESGQSVSPQDLVARGRADRNDVRQACHAILSAAQRLSANDVAGGLATAELAFPGVVDWAYKSQLSTATARAIYWMAIPGQGSSFEAVEALLKIGGKAVSAHADVRAEAANWLAAYSHDTYRNAKARALQMFERYGVVAPAPSAPMDV